MNLHIKTASEQVAEHLKEELRRGTWIGIMPGQDQLVARLGAGRETVQAALTQLEKEGLLVPQGKGKRRLIQLPDDLDPDSLRVRILMFSNQDTTLAPFNTIRHSAAAEGHNVEFADQDLHDLKMDPRRIAGFVKRNPAEAWIVVAAPTPVLKWFADQPTPAFAVFGDMIGVGVAGVLVDRTQVFREVTEKLLGLGHRRIVFLSRKETRKPKLMPSLRSFSDTLTSFGIEVGPYHLPDWEETSEGLCKCVDSLFLHTPPTALIIDQPPIFLAVQQHLSRSNIIAPRDVSLVCGQPDAAMELYSPEITCVQFDVLAVVRHALRWIENVARRKEDRRQKTVKSELELGGTIGPVPRIIE